MLNIYEKPVEIFYLLILLKPTDCFINEKTDIFLPLFN